MSDKHLFTPTQQILKNHFILNIEFIH